MRLLRWKNADSTQRRRLEIVGQVTLGILATLVLWLSVSYVGEAIDTGMIDRRRRRDISMTGNPIQFWMLVFGASLLAAASAGTVVLLILDFVVWRPRRDARDRRVEQQDLLVDSARRRTADSD